jgi:uncharacterized peroxidase-related enzyme
MSRIPIAAAIADAPAASQPHLRDIERQTGGTPNMLRMLANSPAALRGFLALRAALATGSLSAATRQRIALAVTEINGCDYCLSAHVFTARQNGLDDAELTANRNAASNDMREEAALRLAAKIATARGHVGDEDVAAFTAAGFSDAELVELVAQIALSIFANYLNEVADTEIDFPLVKNRISVARAARDAA